MLQYRKGSVTLKAKLSDRIQKGTVAVPSHFNDPKINTLISNTLDAISKTPMYKSCMVKVEKV